MLPDSIAIKDPRQVKGRTIVKGERNLSRKKRAPKRTSDDSNQFQEYLDELSEPPFATESNRNLTEDAYGVQLRSQNATPMDNSYSQPNLRLNQHFLSEAKGYENQGQHLYGSESAENLVTLPPLEPYPQPPLESQELSQGGQGQSMANSQSLQKLKGLIEIIDWNGDQPAYGSRRHPDASHPRQNNPLRTQFDREEYRKEAQDIDQLYL